MDVTLRKYASTIDNIQSMLNVAPIDQVPDILTELESYVRLIQSITFKAADVYNNYKKKLLERRVQVRLDANAAPMIPTSVEYDKSLKKMYNNTISRELAPNINVAPIIVNDAQSVPNTPIYYIEDINKFAFKLNGMLFSGNIGEIYGKNDKNIHYVKACKKTQCYNHRCKYHHDNGVRNFTSDNWLHTSDLKSHKNLYMRHFGSRSTLSNDLDILTYDSHKDMSLDIFMSTVMHDILVALSINQKNVATDDTVVSPDKHTYTRPPSSIMSILDICER